MKQVLCLFALAGVALAGPILTSQVRCSVYDAVTAQAIQETTANNYCQIGDGTAHGSRGETMSSISINGNGAHARVSAISSAWMNPSGVLLGITYSTIELEDILRTVGNPRPGIVKYAILKSASPGDPFVEKAPFEIDFFWGSNEVVQGQQAIVLGVNHPLLIRASASGDGSISDLGSMAGVSIQMDFYEFDGVTPVDVFSVPEPSTWIAGFGLLGFGAAARLSTGRILRKTRNV